MIIKELQLIDKKNVSFVKKYLKVVNFGFKWKELIFLINVLCVEKIKEKNKENYWKNKIE